MSAHRDTGFDKDFNTEHRCQMASGYRRLSFDAGFNACLHTGGSIHSEDGICQHCLACDAHCSLLATAHCFEKVDSESKLHSEMSLGGVAGYEPGFRI